ncbi:hypothetical protein HYFRA_00003740 [Hymenoscyphus fraxineus]|uniref:Epoxide hydrolase N-terminal domain-containing protein n=1 Tax=Hymenoscyphus fraxineus TaxID=746836 RepID=A0A9N9L137_9HELO|nr:hypothetical protein HYFRA_00003740 [Hymenoscyphus fraxineus]
MDMQEATSNPTMEGDQRNPNSEEEIQPYKIHVSSKYLSLTQKKLELTRLPHEVALPKEREWELGAPKNEIEPLIDFWLENYSWRTQEAHLNNSLPQYRIAFRLPPPSTSPPLRIHFVHIRSRHRHAIPLLLIPSFPLTNLSLIPLFAPLSDPASPTSTQPFHLVVPSIPGLGFSDPFQTPEAKGNVLEYTAMILNSLMLRLKYDFYLASATGSGRESALGVDYHLPRLIGERFPGSCLGVSLLEPEVQSPRVGEGMSWVKFRVARFLKAAVFGYVKEDWKAMNLLRNKSKDTTKKDQINEESPLLSGKRNKSPGTVGVLGLREPTTLSYALCDSPVGLLAVFCSGLRKISPNHSLSPTEIIDVTSLAWLPGIEAGARFWAAAAKEIQAMSKKPPGPRTRVAITVFRVDGSDPDRYTCPAWATRKHNVVFTQRAVGLPGLVPWERVDVVVAGVRGLAREIGNLDPRLKSRRLEEVLMSDDEYSASEDDESGHDIQLDVGRPDTVANLNTNHGAA